jgi:FkbM family methyltransferase
MDKMTSIPTDYLVFLQTSVPTFWETKTALMRLQTVKLLSEFYAFILIEGNSSHSQLFQDTFVDFVFQKKVNKKFLEFGATNGVELSNTFMLETKRGWQGVLAEPDPQWHDELLKNRPSAKIISDCIYSQSGHKMRFISSSNGVYSSLKNHSQDDANGPLGGNSKERLRDYKEIDVMTISLNDVFEKFFNGESIEYMSVDTEGSEYEILSNFDFQKYHPPYCYC